MKNSMKFDPETLGDLIEEQYNDLAAAAEKLGSDHITWSPNEKGRSALSQLHECIDLAQRVVRSFDGAPYEPSNSVAEHYPDMATAVSECKQLGTTLGEKIRAVSAEKLLEVTNTPFAERSIGRMLAGLYWNAAYHEGQIVYISTLV